MQPKIEKIVTAEDADLDHDHVIVIVTVIAEGDRVQDLAHATGTGVAVTSVHVHAPEIGIDAVQDPVPGIVNDVTADQNHDHAIARIVDQEANDHLKPNKLALMSEFISTVPKRL